MIDLADARAWLSSMEDNSADAIVADPPYGIGFRGYDVCDDDPSSYAAFMRAWLAEARRVVKPGGPVFVWQAQPQIPNLHNWFDPPYRIMAACKNFVQIYPGPAFAAFDPVVAWWKPGAKPYADADGVTRDWFIADTTPSGRKRRNEAGLAHPCPRPIEHVQHIIRTWTPPGGLVLDPFTGSGTTGVACAMHGRRFAGCEISEAYAADARKRIAMASSRCDNNATGGAA